MFGKSGMFGQAKTDPNSLKTKRERIIHNEVVKTEANLLIATGVLFGFGIIYTEALNDAGWWGFLSALASILVWATFYILAARSLSRLVDPDDLPKPKRKARRKKMLPGG